MKVLVVNTGSSSIKYRLFEMDGERALAAGLVEKIGEACGRLEHRLGVEGRVFEEPGEVRGHREAMEKILAALTHPGHGAVGSASEVRAVGHRVVHGGEELSATAVIDDEVIAAIRDNAALAPLHNPANLVGIQAARELFPNALHAAVFDTAFHQTLPPRAYLYALPLSYYRDLKIRRYGFHGTSHRFVAFEAARLLGRPIEDTRIITIHLGNGSSMSAVRSGKSVDTSMGMTPLEGLVMGTRAGDVDPAIFNYLARNKGMKVEEVEDLLNRGSGLKGLAGVNDMREILAREAAGDEAAALAVDIYSYRIKKYVGAYLAAMGGADAVVFTGGVGENAPAVRARALEGLAELGIEIDPARNRNSRPGPEGRGFEIGAAGARVKVLVVPTNEELAIARETVKLAAGRHSA